MLTKSFSCLVLSSFIALCGSGPDGVKAEEVVDIPTRPGVTVRGLFAKPAAPVGSVILLAGGHGNLNLGKDGSIGWGKGNQVVRTRADYAKAGFAVLVPDMPSDLKEGGGVRSGARWSKELAADYGELVRHMRTVAQPVFLVGTSRGALTVAAAATKNAGPRQADGYVITAGMIAHISDKQPSAERSVGGLGTVKQPVFIVYHRDDGCAYTPASSAEKAKALFSGSSKVEVKILTGGSAGRGDPCDAQSPHGFIGLDAEVVALVTGWLKALPKK